MSSPAKRMRPLVGSRSRVIEADEGGLPASRLPHQADALAGGDGEVHVVDRVHRARRVAEREALGECRDLEQRRHAAVAVVERVMARHPVERGHLEPGQRRRVAVGQRALAAAAIAAGRERAAQVRHRARDRHEVRELGARARRRRDEPRRVGMAGPREQLAGRRRLHHVSGVHDDDPVAALGHHAEVVGDQDGGHVAVRAEVAKEIEDGGLGGHVDPRGRLVGDQERGRTGQGQGDHHALAHPARQLEGIGAEAPLGIGDLHARQQLDRLGPRVLASAARVDPQHAGVTREHVDDLLAHGADGVERGARILEDHRHLAPAALLELARAGLEEVESPEDRACPR